MSAMLTKNFALDEFECHDGVPVPTALLANVQELARNLQVLRDEVGRPVKITSGYRHEAYNRKIGGAKNSQHVYAKAADIQVKGLEPEHVARIIEKLIAAGKMKQGGLGIYKRGWVHYDVRGKKARWRG